MQTQNVGWTTTLKETNAAIRYAENTLIDIRAGRQSLDVVCSNRASRYALAIAFDIDTSTPESLVEQNLIVHIPQKIIAMNN